MPTAAADCKANAERCAELAKAAKNDVDRKVWLGMQRYWLARLRVPANGDPPIIESIVKA
jgi:hypothetical protein